MKTTIDKINNSIQSIYEQLCLLESLAILLKNYCLNNSYDISALSEKEKRYISLERNNCINVTELAITTIESLKNTGENLEENIFFLNQYANNRSR